MRRTATLLLLLLLPGLLLPAGLWLHVCRCLDPARMAQAACCVAPPSAEPRRPACCAETAEAGLPADEAPKAQAKCGCTWLPLPDTRQDQTPPDLPAPAAALPPRLVGVLPLATLARAQEPRRWRASQTRAPPPPDRARNLPLRL